MKGRVGWGGEPATGHPTHRLHEVWECCSWNVARAQYLSPPPLYLHWSCPLLRSHSHMPRTLMVPDPPETLATTKLKSHHPHSLQHTFCAHRRRFSTFSGAADLRNQRTDVERADSELSCQRA
eukprot:1485158-Rhodomonas_salina.2